jgi:hypothetical protein
MGSHNVERKAPSLPYVKCAPCRIRLRRDSPEVTLFDGLCPVCGLELEPATELVELVGFSAFDLAQGDRAFAPAPGDREQLDAGRWIDDGGS